MLDWLIIGGGIQGMTTVTYLLQSGRTTVEKICIVDPFEKPLMNWEHCTSIIEMPFLRSPFVHHLEVDHFGLQAFEKRDKNQTSFLISL